MGYRCDSRSGALRALTGLSFLVPSCLSAFSLQFKPFCRSGGARWRYRSNGLLASGCRRCTAPLKEGKEGVRSAVAVLLRVVVLRSDAETTLRPRGLTGEAWACAHSPPDPLALPPCRRAAESRACGGRGFGGSYPVTTGRQMRTARSSVGRGRSSGGVRSGRRAACSCSFRGRSLCLAAAARIISRMLILFPPNRL